MHLKDGIASEPMLLKVFLLVLVLILSIIFVPAVNYVKSSDTDLINDSVSLNNNLSQNMSSNSTNIENDQLLLNNSFELKYDCQVDFERISEKTGLAVEDIRLMDCNSNGLFDTIGSSSNDFSKKISDLDLEIKEVEHKSKFMDVVKNSDDANSAFFYTRPVNFYNFSSNNFEPIDLSLVKSNNEKFIYENTRNHVETFFGKDGKAFFERNSFSFFSYPEDQYFSSKNFDVDVDVSENSIVYTDLYDDIDLNYRVYNGVVSEEFILKKELDVENVSVKLDFFNPVSFDLQDNGEINFYNKESNELLFVIEKPFMFEQENPSCNSEELFYKVEKIDDLTFKIYKVFTDKGLEWMHDSERCFPVVIDPVYKYYSDKTFDGLVGLTGLNWADVRTAGSGSFSNSSVNYSDSALSSVSSGQFPTTYGVTRSFFAFNTSNLSSDATIDSVSLFLYGYGNSDSSVMAQEWTDGSDGLSVDDYSALNIDKGSYGNSSGWIIDGYNQIDFDSLGIENIDTNDFTYIACREYDHDYSNVTPSGSNSNGVYFSDWEGGQSRHPYLQIDFTLDTVDPSTDIAYPQNIDYLNELDNITGSASDNIQVTNVTMQIKNNSGNTYWSNVDGGWGWFSLEEIEAAGESSWFNVTPEDGGWGETSENWYYNCSADGIIWENSSYYTISAKSYDDINTDPSPDSESFWYDDQLPNSYVNTISPYLQTNSPIDIDVTANDPGVNASGIKNVTLWYRYSNDNQSWNSWVEYSTDSSSPWQWSFNFPNGDGYYEFYSISFDNAFNIETKTSNDTICRYNSKIPPVINNFNLKNNTGSKIDNATGLLDINKKYYFEINITDENGWGNIGYVNITSWFDGGNENSFYNQTLGGNLNMFLQYKNTTGSAEFKMLWPDNEAELITNDCSETIISPKTRIIQIYFKPKNQVRWAESNKTWATTNNICNDIYSWNFNITVSDQEDLKDYVIGEYGVDRFTYIEQVKKLLYVTVIPGYDGDTNTVSMNFSSNYDYKIILYFEKNLINSTSGLDIEIKDNVDILADADEDDDILTDQTFNGIGENNAIEAINSSGVFSSDGFLQSINFRFNVDVPLGTYSGKYNSRIATKITQK